MIYKECFYIGSSDKLPPPLDLEQERALLIEMHKGSDDARETLIEHNLRLVVFIAKKYESTGYDIEDLVSIGSIGLIKGINTYKISKNIKLATYVSRCIANEILMYVRKNKKTNEDNFEEIFNFTLYYSVHIKILQLLQDDILLHYKAYEQREVLHCVKENYF